MLRKAFIRRREAITELRFWKPVVEGISTRGLRIGRKRPRARRLPALNQSER
jgi:hypothetical protein